jgi:S-adenosylmethionine:tRNA-ribosyltransferase-isomerase (queuine synthetase)
MSSLRATAFRWSMCSLPTFIYQNRHS